MSRNKTISLCKTPNTNKVHVNEQRLKEKLKETGKMIITLNETR